MILYYTLDKDKNLVPQTNVMKWAEFFENDDRIVKQDEVGEYFISTVFIGIDHNLFETMVFKGSRSELYQDRYSTWQEALAGHNKTVEWVNNGCNEDEF